MAKHYTKSVAATHFTGALEQGEVEVESFPGLRGDGIGEISTVTIQSKERLAWAFEVQDNSGNILGRVDFKEEDAQEDTVGSDIVYVYNARDVDIPITVACPNVCVQVGLRNNSATAKTAGDDGAVVVIIGFCK
jgi:hypothetical protein